jgi:hypothetical protein
MLEKQSELALGLQELQPKALAVVQLLAADVS